jgi:hypothetical protein
MGRLDGNRTTSPYDEASMRHTALVLPLFLLSVASAAGQPQPTTREMNLLGWQEVAELSAASKVL